MQNINDNSNVFHISVNLLITFVYYKKALPETHHIFKIQRNQYKHSQCDNQSRPENSGSIYFLSRFEFQQCSLARGSREFHFQSGPGRMQDLPWGPGRGHSCIR